ncbi:hypothetical protein, partial [Chamaesiphon polymorphus]
DENFEKFSQLLEVDGIDHKGLGRLVYLAYFNNVKIESFYEISKKRIFTFNSKFIGKADVLEERGSGSSLFFDGYCKDRIYKYDYLTPYKIKESLIQEFFPLFFSKKEKGKSLNIKIELEVEHPNSNNDFYSSQSVFNLDDLPQLHKVTLEDESTDLFRNLEIHYSIENKAEKNKSIYTAVCVDNRALELDLVQIEAIPSGYQLRFLFVSDYFQGKVNTSRQKLLLPDELTEKALKEKLREEIGNIIICNIPKVKENNQRVTEKLNENFPHLTGYFPKPSAGLILKTAVLELAQSKFFNDQRKILECENLDDEQYEKAIELSSRSLVEYVMYRSLIIQKLKSMTSKNHEKELHQLIVPMQQTLQKEEFDDDIYNNNVWLLDDRFMTYNTILSDETMQDVIQSIALDNVEDNSRPDITIVFSGNPNTDLKVNVVVVELKKHGLPLAKNEEVLSQLRQRARKLLAYFPNKIEKIWFYGITDIDSDFRRSLKEDGYKELFSHGQMFFKPQNIIIDDENNPFIIDLFVMTYDSFINDAESRNAAFLRVLKSTIRKCIESAIPISPIVTSFISQVAIDSQSVCNNSLNGL